MSFARILKTKKNALLTKLVGIFLNYKRITNRDFYRYVYIYSRRKRLKNKYFIIKKNLLNNINIITMLKFKIANKTIHLRPPTSSFNVNNYFLYRFVNKKAYFLFDLAKRNLYFGNFSLFYFFAKLKTAKIRKKLRGLIFNYILFFRNVHLLLKKENLFINFKLNQDKLYFPQTFWKFLNLLFKCLSYYYIHYKTPLLFKNAALEVEYEYLVDYYNEIFDYKDLSYYEKQYRNVFNFCKTCFYILKIDADFLIKEFSLQ